MKNKFWNKLILHPSTIVLESLQRWKWQLLNGIPQIDPLLGMGKIYNSLSFKCLPCWQIPDIKWGIECQWLNRDPICKNDQEFWRGEFVFVNCWTSFCVTNLVLKWECQHSFFSMIVADHFQTRRFLSKDWLHQLKEETTGCEAITVLL